MEAVNIALQDGYAEVSYLERGVRQNKIIDIDDLHGIFKDNVDYDSGDLGVWGENAMGIKRIISRGDKHWIFVEAINPLVTTQLGSSTFKNVPYPSILMGVHLSRNGVKFRVDKERTFVVCHQNMLLTGADQMFKFPFSNVWADTAMGKICWGSINLPQLDTFAQAIGILQMFLQGTMNFDLLHLDQLTPSGKFKEILTANRQGVDWKLGKIFEELTTLGHFPYSDLGLSRKTKYSDIVKYCKSHL
jgi:hypothetical protein